MTVRNNQDRLDSPQLDSDVPPQAAQAQTGTTFNFVVPTEFVDLPSKGKFYPEGHPLHNKESIEIRHMTAKEEDILTSQSLLKKGIAIDRLLESIIVDKSINLRELLVGDKNALIVGARITGYGSEYETKASCPMCSTITETTFNLEDLVIRETELDETAAELGGGTYSIKLPKSKVSVEVRLLTGIQERKLLDSFEKRKKLKLPETSATEQLKTVIISVGGDTTAAVTNKFIEVMPLADSLHLKKVYEKLNPDINLQHSFECDACLYEGEVTVPLTVDFFWPNR